MFGFIKVIYAHCGKFTMSIKLQKGQEREQVQISMNGLNPLALGNFYTFIKRGAEMGRNRGERVRSVLEKVSSDVLAADTFFQHAIKYVSLPLFCSSTASLYKNV